MGIPLAYVLGVQKRWPESNPLLGIWVGNASALAFAAIWLFVLVVFVIDWAAVRPAAGKGGDDLSKEEASGGDQGVGERRDLHG